MKDTGQEYTFEQLKDMVLTHARRVRRLWFIGACITFCVGATIAGLATYKFQTADSQTTEPDMYSSEGYYNRDNYIEGLQAGAAIGLGFTTMLGLMGCLSFYITGKFVNKSSPATASLKGESVNAMISAGAGKGVTYVLGFIAPVRTLGFTIEENGEKINQSSQLFYDEIPAGLTGNQCQALKFSFFGKTAAIIACKRAGLSKTDDNSQQDETTEKQ